jgi:hypothetical protein
LLELQPGPSLVMQTCDPGQRGFSTAGHTAPMD